MNNKLVEIIQTIKVELNENPNGLVIGKIRDGLTTELEICNNIQSYYDFLKVCDGARCGSIDFFGSDILLKYQFMVETIPGGQDNWFYIGQILYEPVVINKIDSKVYRFYRDNEDDSSGECFGYLDEFLMDYVFGKKYSEIIPDAENDEWYQLLQKLKLF